MKGQRRFLPLCILPETSFCLCSRQRASAVMCTGPPPVLSACCASSQGQVRVPWRSLHVGTYKATSSFLQLRPSWAGYGRCGFTTPHGAGHLRAFPRVHSCTAVCRERCRACILVHGGEFSSGRFCRGFAGPKVIARTMMANFAHMLCKMWC